MYQLCAGTLLQPVNFFEIAVCTCIMHAPSDYIAVMRNRYRDAWWLVRAVYRAWPARNVDLGKHYYVAEEDQRVKLTSHTRPVAGPAFGEGAVAPGPRETIAEGILREMPV